MKESELTEIIACLPSERTFFHYFPGRYAAMLIADAISAGEQSIRSLRASPAARLLEVGAMQAVLGQCGNGKLSSSALLHYWPDDSHQFLLDVGTWGGRRPQRHWYQTSRDGFNLVLRLNFTNEAVAAMQRYLGKDEEVDTNFRCHPVSTPDDRRYRVTLAWARIDCDLETNEALIEEIQSDWVREYVLDQRWVRNPDYVERVRNMLEALGRVDKWWSEAILAAAIWFIRHELGLRDIYYHEHETGRRLKRIAYAPPRALYTKLPRRFAMSLEPRAPEFLRADPFARRVLKRIRPYSFFTMRSSPPEEHQAA